MARTIRHGGYRDGEIGNSSGSPRTRKGRTKTALRRRGRGDRVTTDYDDGFATRRQNSRMRRAADREAVRNGIADADALALMQLDPDTLTFDEIDIVLGLRSQPANDLLADFHASVSR